MAQETNSPRIGKGRIPWGEGFFTLYFKNFKSLLLTNLLFALPLLLSAGIAYLIAWCIGRFDLFILTLPVIFAFPCYAGVTQVTKDIVKGGKINVFQSFKKGIKNNVKYFIFHGIILYLVILITYFSISFYWVGGAVNSAMYVMFALSVLIGIILLFTMYFVPLITVTIEVSFKHVYKNAFLMAFGELPSNFLVTLFLVIMALIFFTISLISTNLILTLIILGALIVFLAPSTVSLIINARLYPKIAKLFKIEVPVKKTDKSNESKEPKVKKMEKIDIEKIKRTDSDYVFHHGRMIKKSALEDSANIIEESD